MLDVVEYGVAGGSGDRVSLICEAVLEYPAAAFESVDNALRNENRSERRVAAGDSLPRENEVRLDAQCSTAKGFPVRPMPVMTSSAMRRIPRFRQISAMRAA